MREWEFVKPRTATDGAVWRSDDGAVFKRDGGHDLRAEAQAQKALGEMGYPVPEIVETGDAKGTSYFIETSLGKMSLHDRALRDVEQTGAVQRTTLDAAAEVSGRLLAAQIRTAASKAGSSEHWIHQAGFIDEVLAENPDLDNSRVRDTVRVIARRLRETPISHGHLDYGLPNAFPDGVIDWQHQSRAPVGFDVYPMLDITAFKGGSNGYAFTRKQRCDYVEALDMVSTDLLGLALSRLLGDFLMVKCFFFLALMKPKDMANRRKRIKWAYRRKLFSLCLESYEHSNAIDTAAFPTLEGFAAGYDGQTAKEGL